MVSDLKAAPPNIPSASVPFPRDSPSSANPMSLPSCPVPGDPEENKLVTREARDMALPQIPMESPARLLVGKPEELQLSRGELF
jgi:hypothetical protein